MKNLSRRGSSIQDSPVRRILDEGTFWKVPWSYLAHSHLCWWQLSTIRSRHEPRDGSLGSFAHVLEVGCLSQVFWDKVEVFHPEHDLIRALRWLLAVCEWAQLCIARCTLLGNVITLKINCNSTYNNHFCYLQKVFLLSMFCFSLYDIEEEWIFVDL